MLYVFYPPDLFVHTHFRYVCISFGEATLPIYISASRLDTFLTML